MTSYEFEDATPVVSTVLGRPAGPNPFAAIIKEIALKTNDKGLPLAKRFPFEHPADPDEKKKIVNQHKNLLAKAGHENDPSVTVKTDVQPKKKGPKGREVPSDTESVLTFWTVERQYRPRKTGTTTATVASDTVPAETAVTETASALTPVE